MPTGEPDGIAGQETRFSPDLIQRLLDKESSFRTFLRKRIEDAALAEDLLQQAFVRALERQHAVRDDESVVPWFYRVLSNTIIDYYRSRGAEARRDEAFLKELERLGDDQVPATDELEAEACHCLYALLPELKNSYTEVLRRVDLDGEAVADVAKELGITPNNLTVRLHRARRALRAGLEQACGVCSAHGCLNCSCE